MLTLSLSWFLRSYTKEHRIESETLVILYLLVALFDAVLVGIATSSISTLVMVLSNGG